LQESRQNHTSAASGVAYAESRGATNLLNWTEAGPKIRFTSAGLRNRTRSSKMSAAHVQTQGVMSSLSRVWSSCTRRMGWMGVPFKAAAFSTNAVRERCTNVSD
jgi:hypothetical protein